jgi:membrane protein YqaA with SNARE-associated domain
MIFKRLHNFVRKNVKGLQAFVDRGWYVPLIALLAALDNLIVIVPTDGILVSSAMLRPKKWLSLALAVSLGSTLGGLGLALLVHDLGLPWILNLFPGIQASESWILTEKFFNEYGLIVVFAIAMSPLAQQPTVILASLANTPLMTLGIVVFSGRLTKYLLMSYIATHAPKLITKFWGIKDELKDAGIDPDLRSGPKI